MRARRKDRFATECLLLGAALLGTLATGRAAAATPPPEVKRIDASCTAAGRLDDAHKGRFRVFADASGAVQPKANDDNGSWIPFRNVDDLKAYVHKGAVNTRAETWSAPDGTFIAAMSFQSDTGDWRQQVDYCFRTDGTLARSKADIFNLATDAESIRTVYYAADGQIVFSTAKASHHRGKRRAAMDGLDAPPVYPTVASLPFNKLLSGDSPPARSADAPASKTGLPVDPELDPNMVAKFIKSQLPIVKACYERALAKNRDLEGRVLIHWTIDHVGSTRDVVVEDAAPHIAQVVPCIVDLVKTWHFPAPSGGSVEVSFPFVFQTSEPDAVSAPSKAHAPSAPKP